MQNLSFFWDRYSRGKNNGVAKAYPGFKIVETITSEGQVMQAFVLGPHTIRTRVGGKSKAIPLSDDPKTSPKIRGDYVHEAEVVTDPEDDTLMLVQPRREGFVLRTFRTGLIPLGGGSQQDLRSLRLGGKRLGYHGSFPLDVGSALRLVEGQDTEVTQLAEKLADEQRGKIRGLRNVPALRDITYEMPFGGAVINRDLDGSLTIHEVKTDGSVKIWEVTDDPHSQQVFEKYLEAELEELGRPTLKAKDTAGTQLPEGHPDK
jgi:hypothetical protein